MTQRETFRYEDYDCEVKAIHQGDKPCYFRVRITKQGKVIFETEGSPLYETIEEALSQGRIRARAAINELKSK